MTDLLVLFVYFVFLAILGVAFKNAASSTSEYFSGGGKMLWWMVGSTAFMTSLSAMTFTALMGKALVDGMSVGVVFLGNAAGYFCNYLFFAAKARQMRVISPIQAIRLRFGKLNEQVFTWSNIPISVINAGIWLNGLAVFTSAVVGYSLNTTIIVTGAIVLFMSLVGGSWAVIASDVLQMVIITIMTFIAGMVAIWKSGGLFNLLHKGLPIHPVMGAGYNHAYLFVGWFVFIFVKQFFSTNNIVSSYRYIASKDSNHARKAALLACGLSCLGPIIWFLPAWYVSGNYPDPTTWGLHGLGNKIADATYYIFVKREMPVGMVGLMLAAMFAATMSSMDSALNRNAGIMLTSVYEPYFCKDTSDKHLMFVSKLLTAVFGIIIIVVALGLTSLRQFGLFDLMMLVGTLVGFPMLIPSILGFFVRKTPDWAGWGTIAVGVCVSAIIYFFITKESIHTVFGVMLTDREFSETKSVTCGVVGHMCITLPFFFLTKLFYKEPVGQRKEEIEKFFYNVTTEIIVEDTPLSITMDNRQNSILGKMLAISGICVLSLMLVPNPLWGRLLFAILAGMLILLGGALILSQRKVPAEPKS